uniref:Proteasome subunit beta n=1 Tax=Mantoniella antarctica TaxID=81844 RepID=A0A7S0X3I1_9CHLO|mmetsp:Transcript_15382/g.37825  ORF Transcript_15382/g.37825 Transcript_15382/m.37825 type:complete len:204 (+) Transcript_15382:266-877(+)
MDVLFAFVGDKFAVVVTDTTSVQQIIIQKDDMEKTMDLDSHKLMALSGPKGDCTYFSEYIQANMKLYELKNGCKLSTHAAASFTRTNLAESLRKGPYQVNILLAGYDADVDECSLYFMDYMASMQKVNSGGHGYGGMFCLSLFDKHWKPKMTRVEASDLVDKCIAEVRERLVTAPAKYHVKIVDKDGTSCTTYDCEARMKAGL